VGLCTALPLGLDRLLGLLLYSLRW